MANIVLLHDRCLAMQLSKEPPPLLIRVRSHPSPLPPIPPGHQSPTKSLPSNYQPHNGIRAHGSLSRRMNTKNSYVGSHLTNPTEDVSRLKIDSRNGKQDYKSDSTEDQHCSTESGSPTPTNALPPIIPKVPSPKKHVQNEILNGYQDGFLLFQSWVSANIACVWDEELVKAVRSIHFVGLLVGGFVLIGGTARALASICHAHSRALLCAPPGWIIVMLGEVQDCSVNVVIRGQFTPLGDALCWVIHYLTNLGQTTEQEAIRKTLLSNFTSMVPPEPALIHAAISDLIRQRKVFHSINGYGIVKRETYSPALVPSPVSLQQSIPKLLSTSEALTKAHGDAETVKEGKVTHTAVQTDLIDLVKGPRPVSTVVGTKPETVSNSCFQRSASLKTDRKHLNFFQDTKNKSFMNKYEAEDQSDIIITGTDRISVFSKLLRVSNSRKRLATFSVQFPPPTWNDPANSTKHFHSVATQTRSAKFPTSPDSCWLGDTYFIYRSSTLPRRPSRNVSNTTAIHNVRSQSASPSHVKLSENKYNRNATRQSSSVHSSPKHDSSLVHSTAKPYRNQEDGGSYSRVLFPHKKGSWHLSKLEHAEIDRASAIKAGDDANPLGYIRRKHFQNAFHSTLPRNIGRKQIPIESSYSKSDANLEKIEKGAKTNSEMSNTIRSIAGCQKKTIEYAAKRQIVHNNADQMSQPIVPDNDDQTLNDKEARKDRAKLHLELTSVSMNNSKKVLNSPQNAESFKSNGFLENFPSTAKTSLPDLTIKNLGYTDVDKSEKKMYSKDNHEIKNEILSASKSIPLLDKSVEIQTSNKDLITSQLNLSELKNKLNGNNIDINGVNQDNDDKTVKNFPSLSNLHFSSLAAQKILQGVSMNSIDTLVEVNLVAEKQKTNEIVTNTDFGFV